MHRYALINPKFPHFLHGGNYNPVQNDKVNKKGLPNKETLHYHKEFP